jgi:predicted Zn-dependent peptidase
VVDPFTQHASPASAAVVIVGDVAAQTIRELVHAAAPDLPSPAMVIAPAPSAEPARDTRPLLVAALALLAVAAGFVAWRERPYARRGSSAQ